MNIKKIILFIVFFIITFISPIVKEFQISNYNQVFKNYIRIFYEKSTTLISRIKEEILIRINNNGKITTQIYFSPLNYINITSDFGWRKKQIKRNGSEEFHNGIDIKAKIGTPVYSVSDGKVYETGISGISGKYVIIIDIEEKYKFIFSHLSKVFVKQGVLIRSGMTIALSGNSGKTTGPHLHFGVYDLINGKFIDPKMFIQHKIIF